MRLKAITLENLSHAALFGLWPKLQWQPMGLQKEVRADMEIGNRTAISDPKPGLSPVEAISLPPCLFCFVSGCSWQTCISDSQAAS